MITKKMSSTIKSVGFIMTLIIVFYHCNYRGEPFGSFDGKAIGIIDSSAEALAFVAMCWFFSISGFLLFRNLTLKNYAEKLKKRAVSLLVPYFIWEFAAVVPLIVIPLIRHSSIVSSKLFQDLLCISDEKPAAERCALVSLRTVFADRFIAAFSFVIQK